MKADIGDLASFAVNTEDSIDELALALLKDSSQATKSRPTYNSSATKGLQPAIGNIRQKLSDQPLPSSSKDWPIEEEHSLELSKKAVLPKSTNLKISSSEKAQCGKLQISHPVLHGSGSTLSTTNASPGNVQIVHTLAEALGRADSSDEANISRKISTLIQMAESKENANTAKRSGEPNVTRTALMDKPAKLKRGKKALVRAKQAITDRLSNGREKQRQERTQWSSSVGSSLKETETHRTQDPPSRDSTRRRLDRRIAEGENLSKIKIQSLTGDGSIPRKPLPVYESMRSPTSSTKITSNGIFNNKQADDAGAAQDLSSFDFNFDKPATKRSSKIESLLTENEQYNLTASPKGRAFEGPRPVLRYSSMVSGLAQHQDVNCFSSSPIDYSTPRTRLEPQYDVNGKKRLATVLVRSPSILDFSFEETSEDEIEFPTHNGVRNSFLSLKRKTAKEDLRATSPPILKKAKKEPDPPKEDETLTMGLAELDTSDRGVLSIKDKNTKLKRAKTIGSKAMGLRIFEANKGKEPILEQAAVKKTRGRLTKGQQELATSLVFKPRYHQRRASDSNFGTVGDDGSMSMDELQMDEIAHQVGVRI